MVVSLLGFLDATYLTISHYSGLVLPCTIVQGCEIVLHSAYATLFGIPVALLGAIYYALVFLFTLAYFDTKNHRLLRHVAFGTTLGFAFSLWFLYVQAFLLHQFCQYCLLSALTSTILFAAGMHFLRKMQVVE